MSENNKSSMTIATVLIALAFIVAENLGQSDSTGNFFYAVLDFIANETPHIM